MQHSIIQLLCPADIISMMNAVFSFLAIVVLILPIHLYADQYRLSLLFLFLALLADGLDGMIARKTTQGPLGPYFEAMGDFSSTGVATSVFVVHNVLNSFDSPTNLMYLSLIGVVLIYLICCLLRLAAFHPLQSTNVFRGLPAPAASIMIVLSVYLFTSLVFFIPLILCLSLLMISPIYYMKPGKKLNSISAILIILVLLFDTSYFNIFPLMLLVSVLGYILLSPFFISKVNEK